MQRNFPLLMCCLCFLVTAKVFFLQVVSFQADLMLGCHYTHALTTHTHTQPFGETFLCRQLLAWLPSLCLLWFGFVLFGLISSFFFIYCAWIDSSKLELVCLLGALLVSLFTVSYIFLCLQAHTHTHTQRNTCVYENYLLQ